MAEEIGLVSDHRVPVGVQQLPDEGPAAARVAEPQDDALHLGEPTAFTPRRGGMHTRPYVMAQQPDLAHEPSLMRGASAAGVPIGVPVWVNSAEMRPGVWRARVRRTVVRAHRRRRTVAAMDRVG